MKTKEKDIYKDLKNASKEDLISAVKYHFTLYLSSPNYETERQYYCGYIDAINIVLKILQPEGWMEVAPIWLKQYKKHKSKRRIL